MNILILNWRDPKNPRSGGAEKVTFRYAQYWAKKGHVVTWVCNTFPKSLRVEMVSEVKFVRIGPDLGFTVPQLLVTYPLFLLQGIIEAIKIIYTTKIDVVIDEIHGLPFFAPLYSKTRNVLLVCEVAGSIWDKMYPFPVNRIGKLLEKFVYFIYQDIETWAISKNTKKDIFDLNHNSKIKILPLGIDQRFRPQQKKFPLPSAVFLGRLVKMKGVETAIYAAADITHRLPEFHLYIIGTADTQYQQYLKQLVAKFGINKNVTFCGQLPENEKYKFLSRAHFLFHPSYKEGFGLTVLEAGLVGTPSIVRSGSSLDELVKDRYSGLIFKTDNQMAALFVKWYSGSRYDLLSRHAKERVLQYKWDKILPKVNLGL